MNLSEKRRAETMIREAFNNRESAYKRPPDPTPSVALVKKARDLARALDDLIASAHFRRGSRDELVPTNDHPEYVKARAAQDARRTALHAEREEWIRRLWADELTWDDIKKVQVAK